MSQTASARRRGKLIEALNQMWKKKDGYRERAFFGALTSFAEGASIYLRTHYGWEIFGLLKHNPQLAHLAYILLYNIGNLPVGYGISFASDMAIGKLEKKFPPDGAFAHARKFLPALYGVAFTTLLEYVIGSREFNDLYAGAFGSMLYVASSHLDRRGRKG